MDKEKITGCSDNISKKVSRLLLIVIIRIKHYHVRSSPLC